MPVKSRLIFFFIERRGDHLMIFLEVKQKKKKLQN